MLQKKQNKKLFSFKNYPNGTVFSNFVDPDPNLENGWK